MAEDERAAELRRPSYIARKIQRVIDIQRVRRSLGAIFAVEEKEKTEKVEEWGKLITYERSGNFYLRLGAVGT